MNLWHVFGAQLKKPSGILGHATGFVMRYANSEPNRLALHALEINAGDKILELGFGPGLAVAAMLKHIKSGRVYGVDASATMLAQARHRNCRSIKTRQAWLRHGSFFPLPFADNALDKILAVNVIYFWDNAREIAAECRRILRPGGKIVLYATDASSMQHWKFADSQTHILHTQESIVEILKSGGFDPAGIIVERHVLFSGIVGLVAIAQK